MPFQPFSPRGDVHVHTLHLPHWRQWGCTYFVTARLWDSLPRAVIQQWRIERDTWLREQGLDSLAELGAAEEAVRRDYHRRFSARFHRLLDAGHGACLLRRADCGAVTAARLVAGHGTAYHLDAWVIMPNHLHALVAPARGQTLGAILRHWKGGSARDINRATGRTGAVWQRESFDHIVRSGYHLHRYRKYIAENPLSDRGGSNGCVLGFGARQNVRAALILQGGEESAAPDAGV